MASDLIYELDEHDVLVYAAGGWDEFARGNDAPDIVASNVIGRSLYDFIDDAETRSYQHLILAHARQVTRPLGYVIRCDSPRQQRLVRVNVESPDGRIVRFRTSIVGAHPQNSGPLLERAVPRQGGPLRVCSWCVRVQLSRDWVDPVQAARALGLFNDSPVPELTHGMCESCAETALSVAQS